MHSHDTLDTHQHGDDGLDSDDEIRQMGNDRLPMQGNPRTDGETPYGRVQQVVRKAWTEFRTFCNQKNDKDSRFMPSVPTKIQLQAFLRFCTRRKNGTIGKTLTTTTLKKYLRVCNRIIKDEFGDHNRLPSNLMRELNAFVDRDLVRKGAVQSCRVKPIASTAVIEDMHRFLWVLDEHEYDHPRERLQLSLITQIFLYTGMRPGELVESHCYRNSNEGLLWKDVEFEVKHSQDSRRFFAKIRIRNRKGGRGVAAKA